MQAASPAPIDRGGGNVSPETRKPNALGYNGPMSTILNTNGMRVVIYPADHRPAHVHVMGADYEVVFALNCPDGPIELRNIGAGKVSRARIEQIRRILAPISTSCAPPGGNIMAAITDTEIAAAREAGAQIGPRALAAWYFPGEKALGVELDNGVKLSVPVRLIQGLESADDAQLATIEISPAGWGLHFPAIDADVYVPALFGGVYGSRAWMRELGRRTSPAKAAASRENGRKGGRPRKTPATAATEKVAPTGRTRGARA